MSKFWDMIAEEDRRKEEEEEKKRAEEEKKKAAQERQDRVRESLSFWEQVAYDKKLQERGDEVYHSWDKSAEEPVEEEPKSLIDRLAARGVTVEMPTEKKAKTPEDTAYTAEDQYGFQSLRPSLTGEGSTLADTAGKNLFTNRLRNTATANEERTNQLAAQLEETKKDETVRNEEWLNSLRSKEEIEKDLEEAKKETGAAKRQDFVSGLLGDLRGLVDNEYRLSRSREDLNPKTKENEARIKELEDELAERTWADYERLRNNADFDAKSQYKSTATGKEAKVGFMGADTRGAYEDPLYDYINGDTNAKWELERKKFNGLRQNAQYDTAIAQNAQEYTQYSYLTKDEKSLYNYIHATEGAEKANEYLTYLMSDLYERQAEKEKAQARDWADQNGLTRTLASAGSVLASPIKGAAYLGQAAEMLTTGKIDENAPYNRAAYIPNELRNTVSKDIERNWGQWGSFAYNTGMSMLDFLWNSAVSSGSEALSLALMGTGAAADATMAAKERGLDDKTSFVLGTIAGAAEIVSEKVSIEALFKAKDWKTAPVKYILQNFFFEGAEEVESDAINWLADAIVARDKSEWMDDIRAYQKDNPGASDTKAFWSAVWKRVKEGGLDFLGGAISGGVMAGTRVAGANILDAAKKNSDLSESQEKLRAAYQAKNAQNAADISAGMQQAQQAQPMIMMPTEAEAAAGQGPRIIEQETQTAQNAPEAAQNAEARPEGINLLTAEQAERAKAAETTQGSETASGTKAQEPRFGTEPEVRTMTPTAEQAEIDEAVQKALDEGSITRATGIRYGVDEKTIRKAENFGKTTGRTVAFYEQEGENGTVQNGFYDRAKNRIFYNVKAKNPFEFTVAHEFLHSLEGTQAYNDLLDHIKSRYAEQGKDWVRRSAQVQQLYDRSGHGLASPEEVDQEIAADWFGENLSDEKTIREICRENPSAAKKIRDSIDNFVIKAANVTGTLSPYEVKKLNNVIGLYTKYLGRLEEARQNAQPQAVPAQPAAENAQPAAEIAQPAAENAQGKISPDQLRAQAEELYDEGEIDEEQYDEMNALADEMESTGRGIESSTVAEEAPNGKLGRAIDKMLGRQYSISGEEQTQEVARKVEDGKRITKSDEVRYSLSMDEEYQKNAEKKNASTGNVEAQVLRQAGEARAEVKEKLESVKETANLPPDIPGNTAQGNSAYGTSEENTTVCPRSMAIDSLSDAVADQLGRPLTVEESLYIAQEAFNFTDMPQCLYCYVAMDRMAKREYMGEYLNKRNGVIENLQSGMSVEDARDAFMQSETNGGKDPKNWTKAREKRFNDWVKAYQTGAKIIQMSDLASDAAVERAMADPQLAKQVKDAMSYAQSASWAKKRVGYTAYNGHILNWRQSKIDTLNSMFGLRMYSFSDYSPAFVLENMQMVTDAAVRGLKMLAYTKDLDFVRVMAGTDMNINISTFGMDGTDGTVHQDAMQGADWAEAQELRREHPNVGITFVATNDNQVEWALDQDWIDVVIPFHMVKTGATVANIMGYRNYTGESSDRNAETQKKGEIYPNEHQNNREKYFEALEKQGLEPRFKRWQDHPNYMKLVNETRRSAEDTPAVKPIFDVEAAKQSIDGMVKRGGYDVPIGGTLDVQAELAEEMADQISRGMAENLRIRNGVIVDENGKRKYSVSEADDAAYMQAVDDGDEFKAQVFVNDAAEAAGYNTPELYHGTRAFGFTKFDLDLGEQLIFATSDPKIARTYSGETDRTRISDRASINADNLHGEKLIETAKEYLEGYDNYELMPEDERREYTDSIRRDITNTLQNAEDFVNDNEYAFDTGKMQIMDRVLDALTRVSTAETEEELEEAWKEWNDSIWDLKWADDSIAVDFLDAINNRELNTNKNRLSDFMSGQDIYSEKDPYGFRYVFDSQLQIELGAELHKGVYSLYGKSGKQLEIDANGANWNQITPPEELNLNGPQKTRDIAEAAKAQGYDSVRIRNLRDSGGETKYNLPSDIYIFFRANQMKSADPVTYDDEGNVIPLSERFNPARDDIRYSVSDTGEGEQEDLTGLTQKAKSAALRIERQLTSDILQGIDRQLSPTGQEFRRFRRDVTRPAVEAMLRGEPYDTDAVLEATGIDIVGQAAARGAVNDALRRANGELGRIRTAVQETEARKAAREARNAELDARIPQDTGGLIELAKSVKDAQKRLNTLKARTIMNEEDMELAHKIATGQMTEEEAYAQYPFGVDDIINMAQAEREFREAEAPWARYTKRLAKQRYETADKALENADRAKDKGNGFAYARETPERNFRDVFGGDAAALIDDYIRPVHKSEAASTRFKNDYIKRAEDLKLSRKVRRGNANSEAAAVQFLGEALDNVRVLEAARSRDAVRDGKTLEEWRADIQAFYNANPNLDYDKVNQGIAEFQSIYNELINRMNEVLVENGYMPVNVRRGYFPHFNGGNDGILATFAHMLGINVNTNGLPTSINGLTRMFKPGKPWFGHAMERTGFATDYDALQGFEGYLGGVSDVIHQTPNIRNLRALGTRIRYRFGDEQIRKRIDAIEADDTRSETEKLAAIHDLTENGKYKLSQFVAWLDEYTNQLANKTPFFDRTIENLIGRKWYNRLKGLEGRVAANMIAGNLGSALTNFIPMNQAAAMLGDGNVLKGAFQTMTNRAKTDDFINRSDFLTNRRGVDPLIRGASDTVSDWLSKPMNIIDDFTSETIVRAAYNKYLKQGMDEQSAMQAADEFAAGVMADRSKGALPTIFGSHNPLTKLLTQFQVEVNNEFSTIFKDIPKGTYRDDKDKKKAVAVAAWTLLRYFIGAYLFNDVYEHFVGRRAALDPIDLLNDAVGDLTGKKLNNTWDALVGGEGFLEEQKRANPSDAVTDLGKSTLEELPFIGGLLGGGRIPISSALPDAETIVKGLTNENWSGSKKAQVVGRELGKTIGTYILPPFAGGAGKKAFQTVTNTLAGGRFVKDAEGNDQLQYPYFTDTPTDTAKTVAQSLLFGPTATEGGRAWAEGGFGNQSAKNTALYRDLTGEYGESQRESWDFLQSLRQQDNYGKRMAVAESDLTEEGKAVAMETLMNSDKSTEGTKFRAAYNNGVSAEAWAALYGAMEEYDLNGNKQYTQAEIRDALDNITVPISESEGAVQGLFGGSTSERHLTNAEKAALWSAYDPKWATKNNPYDPAIGARVVAEYNRLKNEKAEESEDEE